MRRPAPPATVALLAVLLAALLVVAGCAGPSSGPSSGPDADADAAAAAVDRVEGPGVIPNDFPLTSGWKAGLKAPRRANADLPLCNDPGSGDPPLAAGTDRLLATWAGRDRDRQLTLYPDTAAARAAVRALLTYYRGCPSTGFGELPWRVTTSVRSVPGTASSPSRWEVRQSTADADGVVGGSLVQVVQVRRAVLLDVAGTVTEGRPWADVARSVAEDQVTWGAGVVAAMDDL